tara:strand:+ start:111 stop:590 length:480 start_codon:yes stop_codon:yes gene_type:complete
VKEAATMTVVKLISKGIMTTCQRRDTGIHRKGAGTDGDGLKHLVISLSHFESIVWSSRLLTRTSKTSLKRRLNLKGGHARGFRLKTVLFELISLMGTRRYFSPSLSIKTPRALTCLYPAIFRPKASAIYGLEAGDVMDSSWVAIKKSTRPEREQSSFLG